MKGGRDYDIFPRTGKARFGLAVALLAGLGLMVGYFLLLFAPWEGFAFPPWTFLDKTEITLENRTPYYLTINVDDRKKAVLQPNEEETISDFEFLWWTDRPVEAIDPSGRVIYSANLDDDDLERMGHRIVFEEP